MNKGFSIVVAMDRNRGIGKDGGLPWPKLKGDMKFFRELTTCPDSAAVEKRWGLKPGESSEVLKWEDVSANLRFAHKLPEPSDGRQNIVAMGTKTWESLPERYHPLPERKNVRLSRGGPEAPEWVRSGDGIPSFVHSQENFIEFVFVIGGGQVFGAALKHPACARLYITEIDAEFSCDTFFPVTPGFVPVLSSPWIEENGIRYRFRRYDRIKE